jgi:hypothetical protein
MRTGPTARAVRTTQKAEPSTAARAANTTGAAPEVIVYDVVAGIKTLHWEDGTVEEEAFDPATLPAVKAAKSGNVRLKIVNEANPVSTGSTGSAPSPPAVKAGPR